MIWRQDPSAGATRRPNHLIIQPKPMTLTERLRDAARSRAATGAEGLPVRLRDANEVIDLRDPSPGPHWPDSGQARRLRLTLGRIEDPGDMSELHKGRRGARVRRYISRT